MLNIYEEGGNMSIDKMVDLMARNCGDDTGFENAILQCRNNGVENLADLWPLTPKYRRESLYFDDRLETYF